MVMGKCKGQIDVDFVARTLDRLSVIVTGSQAGIPWERSLQALRSVAKQSTGVLANGTIEREITTTRDLNWWTLSSALLVRSY